MNWHVFKLETKWSDNFETMFTFWMKDGRTTPAVIYHLFISPASSKFLLFDAHLPSLIVYACTWVNFLLSAVVCFGLMCLHILITKTVCYTSNLFCYLTWKRGIFTVSVDESDFRFGVWFIKLLHVTTVCTLFYF